MKFCPEPNENDLTNFYSKVKAGKKDEITDAEHLARIIELKSNPKPPYTYFSINNEGYIETLKLCFLLKDEIEDKINLLPDKEKEKIRSIASRIDFIRKLIILHDFFYKNSICDIQCEKATHGMVTTLIYRCNFNGYDFDSINFEIDSLINYMLISTLDTIASVEEYVDPIEYLLKKIGSKSFNKKEINSIMEEHRITYGINRNFRKLFTEKLSVKIKSLWIRTYAKYTIDKNNCTYNITDESKELWRKLDDNKKMKEIANCLYNMRSQFTHTSVRICSLDQPVTWSTSKRTNTLIQLKKNPKLHAILMLTIKDLILSMLEKI